MNVFAILGLLIMVIIVFAWIIPLIIGIVNVRKTWGKIVLIVSGIWGLAVVVGIGALITLSVFHATRESQAYKEFDPATYSGAMGRIELPLAGQSSLMLTDEHDGNQITVTSTNTQFTVPCGQYQLYFYSAVLAGDQDTQWNLNCQLYKKPENISVGTNTITEISIGQSLTASVSAAFPKPGQMSLMYNLQDDQGRSYSLRKIDKEMESPGFEMLDPQGTVVLRGSFEYG